MITLKKVGGIAAMAVAAATLALAAPSAYSKPPVPGAFKVKKLKSFVFICSIGHRPNIVVLLNHNRIKIPKGAKIFFVSSNTNHIVAQGYKTLHKTMRPSSRVRYKFSMRRVKYYGAPTGCRAYVKWYA